MDNSKNKHICILTAVHPPFDIRIFHKEAKTAVREGYEVTIIAQHERNEVVEGIKIIALPKPRNRFARIFGLAWRAFRLAIRKRADVYHFHDPELLPIGVLLKIFTRAKVIYDVHEDVPQQILTKNWIPQYLRRIIASVFNIVEKTMSKFMDAVITATEDIASKFKSSDPLVIHNYPSIQLVKGPSKNKTEKTHITLVYAGGISRIRGAVEMVRALEYLEYLAPAQDIRLDLIGRFDPPDLEKDIQTLPGYKRVRFLGWLQPPEVYSHLKEADIGLVCLHPEPRYVVALPVKLFEYMAAGLPVIASNFTLWKEIVEGNHCGLCVDPLDPQAIADAIKYLLDNPDEARRMGENGRRAVEEKYNWDQEEKKLLKLYEELLAK